MLTKSAMTFQKLKIWIKLLARHKARNRCSDEQAETGGVCSFTRLASPNSNQPQCLEIDHDMFGKGRPIDKPCVVRVQSRCWCFVEIQNVIAIQ